MSHALKFSIRNGQAVLKKPVLIPQAQIEQDLAKVSFRRQLLIFYKHFFRLRNLIDGGKDVSRRNYEKILRRNFRHISFYTRREVVLGAEVQQTLSEADLTKRLNNTLVFVFNSTVKETDKFDDEEVLFYEDIKKSNTDSMESKIMSTILEMEYQKPDKIKYDFNYEWLMKLNTELTRYDEFMEKSKTGKGFKSKVPMEFIGFKQYETNLMRLNECHGLCL